jgi:hypothetical protein
LPVVVPSTVLGAGVSPGEGSAKTYFHLDVLHTKNTKCHFSTATLKIHSIVDIANGASRPVTKDGGAQNAKIPQRE